MSDIDPTPPPADAAISIEDPRAGDDLYRLSHKVIRHSGAQMLGQLGSAGWEDALESAGLVADLQLLLDFIRRYIAEESGTIHPALERRRPGVTRNVARCHRAIDARMREIDLLITAMAKGPDAERPDIGYRLYLAYAGLFADLLSSLQEEALLLPLLLQLFGERRLRERAQQILAQRPLDHLLGNIRRMVPAASPAERTHLLQELRGRIPPEMFMAVLNRAARPALTAAQWRDLLRRLDVDQMAA